MPNDAPQHAQAAKRKAPPKPKQRSALYLWWNGHHEEMDYQAAVAAEERAWTARNAIADASKLVLVGGRTITSGTWAMRGAALGEIATGGLGAPVAGVLIGMYPGKLNDGEQDFIDRMRAEQMREAPTRVRFTWENDTSGNPTPRGWHTPPGKDSVRVRRMEWDSRRQAYTFTTEEDPGITLIWTPDRTGESKPWDTGNQNPVRIPNPVVVDPLPEDTGIGATTSPTPEEKTFADYILILPVGGVPPIYVYINSDHKYHSPPKGNPPLSAFPDAKKAQAKTPIKGGGKLRTRWKDSKSKIYEWDSQHGTVEVYDRSGRNHLGEFDPSTGKQTKPADPTRKVEK